MRQASSIPEFPSAGDVIDERYVIERFLGEGGMGAVWLATQRHSKQELALKLLKDDPASSPENVRRFLREAQAAGQLRSRNIVRIVDLRGDYVHRGRALPFIVMEYLDAAPLEQRIRLYGPPAKAEALWLLGQLGRALGVAHAAGIVHRDVKPANLFVVFGDDQEPVVKLSDFGVAKLTDESLLGPSAVTSGSAIVGTPMYMAPEQLRGERDIGPAADQWALALVAYFVFTGEHYFAGVASTADLIASVLNDERVRPSTLGRGFPTALDAWFIKSSARRAGDRYASVSDQVTALEGALGLTPAPMSPRATGPDASPVAPPRGGASRAGGADREGGWGTLLVLAALALAGPVLWWKLREPMRPQAPPPAATSSGTTRSPRPEPSSEEHALPARSVPSASSAPTPAPARLVTPRRPAVRAVASRPADSGTAQGSPAASARPRERLPAGAACRRSAECQGGLCVAELCQ